jgi:hypothetical protein
LKVYTNSLKAFINNKNTHIKPSIFLDFIARFPLLAKQLIPTVLEVESASLSWFVVTYTLSLLPAVAKLTDIKEYTAEIEAAYTAILKRAATAEGVPADRLKQLLKDLTQLVKHVKVNVAEFIDVLCTEERMSTFKSLKNLVKGYKAAYERV